MTLLSRHTPMTTLLLRIANASQPSIVWEPQPSTKGWDTNMTQGGPNENLLTPEYNEPPHEVWTEGRTPWVGGNLREQDKTHNTYLPRKVPTKPKVKKRLPLTEPKNSESRHTKD